MNFRFRLKAARLFAVLPSFLNEQLYSKRIRAGCGSACHSVILISFREMAGDALLPTNILLLLTSQCDIKAGAIISFIE